MRGHWALGARKQGLTGLTILMKGEGAMSEESPVLAGHKIGFIGVGAMGWRAVPWARAIRRPAGG